MPDRGLPNSEPIELLPKAAVDAVHAERGAGDRQERGDPAAAIAFALLVAALGMHNFLFVPVLGDAWGNLAEYLLIAVSIGVLLSQAGMLAAGLVFADGRFLLRLLLHWMAAIVLFGSLYGGFLLIDPPADALHEFAVGALSLPAISLGVQAPLWLVRLYFDWRLERIDRPAARLRPWSIGDFLTGTLVTAASLAALRLSMTVAPDWHTDESGVTWLIAVPCISVASLIAVLPFVLATLDRRSIGRGFVFIVVYAISVWIVLCALLEVSSRGEAGITEYLSVGALMVGYALSIAAAGWLARWCGYRLRIGRAGAEASS